jgi:TPP-dependent indolepyruvate ferredoxin oxidoreductase alpha subunit
MRVAAYYNLHKHTFSLQSRSKENYGKVIEHTDHVILKNVKFVVREAGRKKVLKEKQKNVHAYVVGELTPRVAQSGTESILSYNPYLGGSFYEKASGEAVSGADYVILRKGRDNKPIISAYGKGV